MSYRSGYDAAAAGDPVSSCPWKPTAPEAKDWLEGWTQGAGDRLHAAGEYGATLQEKVGAGLPAAPSRSGQGFGDDVHDLWEPASVLRELALKQIAAVIGPTYQCGTQITVVQVAALFDLPVHLIDGTPPPEPSDPKERALARKRRPFVCHRHGAASGGFCRTCARRR